MNKVKTPRSDSYQDYLIESLKDPEDAAAYIEAILEAEDPELQLLSSALQDAVDARVKMNQMSSSVKHYHNRLNKLLTESGGAEIYSLVEFLDLLGFRVAVTVKEC
ncbi:MAG: transcriptional regulator [Hormoscilla sp. GUM202]|nr:transcriptional regulator [Hormoscilla sp. GUM202]